MKRTLCLIALSVLTGPAALAEGAPNALLTADEILSELPGTRMTGVQIGTRVRFVECIEPGGRSVFRTDDRFSEGEMNVTPDGQACFTYPNGTSCFRIQRLPKGYMVRSVDSPHVYWVNEVERGVTSCTASELIG